MRIVQLSGLLSALGLLAGCPLPPGEEIPGEESETGQTFEVIAIEKFGYVDMLTPSQALEVLDEAVQETSPGSHAQLNSAAVALDNGEDDKAVDHLNGFLDKVDKETGKKIPVDDAAFMTFVGESIILGIEGGAGG